jgi:hypothetical protein
MPPHMGEKRRMASAVRTLILPLWGPNGVKNAALEATEDLFGQVVRFYVTVLLTEETLWDKTPRRDRETGRLLADPETGEIRMRRPTADEVLTRAEAVTLATRAHPAPSHDLAWVPGAREAPTVFRRAAIQRAIGLVSSYRSSLARWERRGRKGRPPGMPSVERFPVTIYQGLGFLVHDDPATRRSFLRIKLWDGTKWDWQQIPVRIPAATARCWTGQTRRSGGAKSCSPGSASLCGRNGPRRRRSFARPCAHSPGRWCGAVRRFPTRRRAGKLTFRWSGRFP